MRGDHAELLYPRHLSDALQDKGHMSMLDRRGSSGSASQRSSRSEAKELLGCKSVMQNNEVKMGQVYKDVL